MVWIVRDILGVHGFSSIIQNPSARAFFFSLLGLYLAGAILSLYRKAIAGALFIAWYLSLLIGSMPFHVEYNSTGPLLLFGFPILLQGILYLVYYFSFNVLPIEQSVEDVKN